MPIPDLTIGQRRPRMTDAALRAHGFSPTLIVGLAGAGDEEGKPRTMKAAGKRFAFMRFVITSKGCRAIGLA